jgi:NADH:ubiquinone oxidoreductase subunit K
MKIIIPLLAIIATVVAVIKIPQFIADAEQDQTHWLGIVAISVAMAGFAIGLWLYIFWHKIKKQK